MTQKRVFEKSYEIAFPAGDVFAAMTKTEQLEVWFCERADLSLEPGGGYRFWGRHTPYGRAEKDADQKLTAVEQDRLIAFTWTWGGSVTDVRIELAPNGDGCRVSIRQEAEGKIAGHREADIVFLMDDFWTLAMGNLAEYLKSGQPVLLPDHTPSGSDVILSVEVDAPASIVWRCLTEPAQLDGWLSKSASVDLREGGAYAYGWAFEECECVGPTKILELEPERLLVHDWVYEGDETNRTEWRLEPIGDDRCRVTVRQVGVKSEKEYGGYTNGWAKFLLALREFAGRTIR